jgi:hypothetical protein
MASNEPIHQIVQTHEQETLDTDNVLVWGQVSASGRTIKAFYECKSVDQ